MKVTYNDSLNADELYELFKSAECDDDLPKEKILEAMQKSSRLITVRLEGKLIGIVRSMDDGVLSADIDCLVVHGEHRHNGVEELLVDEMLNVLKDVKYVVITADAPELVEIYVTRGFKKPVMGRTLQRVNS